MSAEQENQVTDSAASGSNKLVVAERAKPVEAGEGIVLTDKAAAQIRTHIAKAELPETTYLYVGVKGGGCSGLQYVLDLRDEVHAPVNDTDEIFQSNGINIVCDLKSFVVGNLGGTTIDWQETMMGAGFSFNNPNARHTCGCGSSYSA
ncbi:MAG: iron-sulfur cluster assembly accessory protein [Phycisphaerae bacterium]|nr:iron-sulfur cluster assembly accessory protein [Phycisphaerae bacterium]